MTNEQIGLEFVAQDKSFQDGVKRYIRSVDKLNKTNASTAKKFGKQWKMMGASVTRATKIMGVGLVAATGAAAAAVTKFTVDSIRSAMDLEAQMSAVAGVMGQTKDAVKPLTELVLGLGLDPKLKVSAEEAADAIEVLARNGLSMTEIMDGAAHSTVLLANATKADFGTAADVVTDSMAVFGVEAANMQSAVNGITSVVVNSKFDINDYALALSQGGAVAAATGVELHDFNTTVATLAGTFRSGSDAGTSLKVMMQRLSLQTGPAADAMKELGLITEDGANQFFDASGNLKGMNEIAILLNGAIGDLSEQQRNAALSTIFGTDSMRAAVAVAKSGEVVYTDLATASKELGVSIDDLAQFADGGITKFEALQAQMGQTDAAAIAAEMMNNLKSALETLGDAIKTIGTRIGLDFLPMLTEMTRQLTAFVSDHADSIVATFKTFSTWLGENLPTAIEKTKNLFSGLAATSLLLWLSIQPIVATIKTFASNLSEKLDPVLSTISINMAAFKGALAGVAAVLATAGLSTVFTGITTALSALVSPLFLVTAGAALLGAAWNANWLGIQERTTTAINAVMGVLQPFIDAFKTFGSGALTEIGAFVAGTDTEFTSLRRLFLSLRISAGLLFSSLVSSVQSRLEDWRASFAEWRTAAWRWLQGASVLVGISVIGYVNKLKAKLAEKLPEWKSSFEDWKSAATDWLTNTALPAATSVGTYVGGLVTSLFLNLPVWIAGFYGYATALVDWIATAVPNAIVKVGEFVASLVDSIGTGKPLLETAVGQWAGALIGWVSTELIPKVWPAMARFGISMMLAVIKISRSLGAAAALIGTAIINKIKETDWAAVGTSILGLLKDGFALTTELLTQAGTVADDLLAKFTALDWKAIGSDALTFVKDGLIAAKETVLPSIATVATSIKEKFTSIDWLQLGKDVLGKIKEGLTTVGETTYDGFKTIATNIKTKLNEVDWFAIGTEIFTKLRDGATELGELRYEAFKLAANKISGMFTSIDWKAVGKSIWEGIKGFFTGEGAGVTFDDFKTAAENIKNKFTEIDWKAVGNTILRGIGGAAEIANILSLGMLTTFSLAAQDISAKFTSIDWLDVGKTIVDDIGDGAENWAFMLKFKVGQIATALKKKFTDIDMLQVGKDLIQGLINGMNALTEKLKEKARGLANALPNWMKSVLGIDSPSKVFIEIGRNIVQGLIGGMASMMADLQAQANRMAQVVAAFAGPGAVGDTLRTAWEDAFSVGARSADNLVSSLSSVLSIFEKIGGGKFSGLAKVIGEQADELKLRQDIFRLLKDAGAAPRQLLGDDLFQQLLSDAPISIEKLQRILSSAALGIRDQAQVAMREQFAALQRNFTLQPLIDTLTKQGRIISDVMRSAFDPISDAAKNDLLAKVARLDAQIERERLDFTTRGSDQALARLNALTSQRQSIVDQLDAINQATGLFDTASVQAQTNIARQAIDLFKDAHAIGLDAEGLFRGFDIKNVTDPNMLRQLASIYNQVAKAGQQTAAKEFEAAWDEVRGVWIRAAREKLLAPVANRLKNQALEIAAAVRAFMDPFQKIRKDRALEALSDIDKQIDEQRQRYLETGRQDARRRLNDLVAMRQAIVNELEALASESAVLNTGGTASSISAWSRVVELAKEAQTWGVNVRRVFAGINVGETLSADALKQMSFVQHQINQNRLESLRREFEILRNMQGLSPIPEISGIGAGFAQQYAASILDPLIDKIKQAGDADNERVLAIREYEAALQRIRDLQAANQRLDFLNQQLDLIKQLKDLEIDPAQIFQGLTLGVNASIEDLLEATTRAIRAMIGQVESDLEIASPSRVFARIGTQIMGGLTRGIQQAAQGPALALQRAVVPQGSVNNSRSLSLNFGGVNINNGMDQAMFEARVIDVVSGAIGA